MVSFEEVVLPVVERFAKKVFADEDRQATAIVLGWWYWHNGPQDLPATVWARCAVRHVLSGRDLPGVGTSAKDIWRKMAHRSGAGMQEVADRGPGPDRLAEDRELWELFLQEISPRERRMLDELASGTPCKKIARRFHRSPARITQIRREFQKQWRKR